MSINMIGTADHLRMAKSVLTDLRNRGFEAHASILFSGDEDKANRLDNIVAASNGQNVDRSPYDAGIVDLPGMGLTASIGPVFTFMADTASSPGGSIDEVCTDMGLSSYGRKLVAQWLEEGKYVLLINNVIEEQAEFLRKQLEDLQGIDALTIC